MGCLNKADILFVKDRVEKLVYWKKNNSSREFWGLSHIIMPRSTAWQYSDHWARSFSEFRVSKRKTVFYFKVKS